MTLVRLCLLFCMGTGLCMTDAFAEHQVVLVASSKSPLSELSSVELRKIFLGFNVKHEGHTVKGIRNTADERLNQIFLQTVVAMSEKAYIRRQLSQTLRQGIPHVAELKDPHKLMEALSSNPHSVTYMWKEDALRMPDVKIIKMLWVEK